MLGWWYLHLPFLIIMDGVSANSHGIPRCEVGVYNIIPKTGVVGLRTT